MRRTPVKPAAVRRPVKAGVKAARGAIVVVAGRAARARPAMVAPAPRRPFIAAGRPEAAGKSIEPGNIRLLQCSLIKALPG